MTTSKSTKSLELAAAQAKLAKANRDLKAASKKLVAAEAAETQGLRTKQKPLPASLSEPVLAWPDYQKAQQRNKDAHAALERISKGAQKARATAKAISDKLLAENASYAGQRALLKAQVLNLKPGTWVGVKWLGAPNSVVLIVSKHIKGAGGVFSHTFDTFDPETRLLRENVTPSQVVKVLGTIEAPAWSLGTKDRA